MQNIKYRHILIFFLAFAVHFLCATNSFAKAPHAHKTSWVVHELKTGHNRNSEMLVNGNNPFQVLNYRTARPGHFIKIFLIELLSFFVCLKYLKNTRKEIYGKYASFLKLLLFPNHVFW
jgi:hypothetical protein